jgi:hypothetical protein
VTLLLAATTVLQAQGSKPGVPTRVGVPAAGAAGQPATASQVNPTTVALAPGVLLPCCILEGVESSAREGSFLVVKNTNTGARERVKMGKSGSAATSSKFRPGQGVAMSLDRTKLAITPFPVEEYKRKEINGNSSWVMKTWVVVSKDGRLDGKTNIKTSEAMRGFTGGVEVVLTDRAGNILHQTQLRTYGVNGTAMGGKSERTVNWNETVPADALNKVSAVVVHHSYEPKVRLAAGIGWIKDNWKLVHKVYKCGKEVYDLAMSDSTGKDQPAPPPPAQGQPTTQPPASDTSKMECLESAGELADQLGY